MTPRAELIARARREGRIHQDHLGEYVILEKEEEHVIPPGLVKQKLFRAQVEPLLWACRYDAVDFYVKL